MTPSLCESCKNLREVRTARSRFLLCELSVTDAAYAKYPPQPVVRCDGHQPTLGGACMTADELAAAVGTAAANELESARDRIEHCLGQLTEEQVWQRPGPGLNSVGNLILHLCGNVRQWVVAGIGGAPDHRNRPAEFAERGPVPKDELLRRLDTVVAEAGRVLMGVSARQLAERRRIQGFDVTGAAAIFDSVPHFRGHTQEIVHMTRLQLGDAYRFAWVPTTPEEGAPASDRPGSAII
jgi:hypothetical protein